MIELSADQEALKALGARLKAEADGKKLRRDLAREIRKALEPAKADVRSALMSMGTAGLPVEGPPLRATVVRAMKAEARLSGKATGARLRVRRKGMPRGFGLAARRLNSKKGWRHRVYGRDVWVQQKGKPGWFDETLQKGRKRYRAAVLKAMDATAQRITKKG